jgi:hypothetical protein
MADQLARTGAADPFTGPEPACGISIGVAKAAVRDWTNKSQKTLGIHIWTQKGNGAYTRSLCQKNEGSVEVKARPIKIGGRIIYRHKRTPFQTGFDR